MAERFKTIETRSWRRNYTGWVAIHAARSMNVVARHVAAELEPFVDDLESTGYLERDGIARGKHRLILPRAVIVAVGWLDRIVPTHEVFQGLDVEGYAYSSFAIEREMGYGDYTPGRWAWVFGDIVKLPVPVSARGMLDLWTVPLDTAVRAIDQMREIYTPEHGLLDTRAGARFRSLRMGQFTQSESE